MARSLRSRSGAAAVEIVFAQTGRVEVVVGRVG